MVRLLVAAIAMAGAACLASGAARAQSGQTVIVPSANPNPQSANAARAFQALRARPDDDQSVIAELKAGQVRQPPYFLLELARRLLPQNKAEAAEYWLLARVRMVYDVMRCSDRTAAADFTTRFFATPETQAILQDQPVLEAAKAKLRQRNDLFAGSADPWWACQHGMAAMTAGLGGRTLTPSDYLKPEAEWAAIRDKVMAILAPAGAPPPR